MKIIITRHGETEENKTGIIQGHLPGKLSDEGISQAKKVSLRLKDEKIDYIFSSDLARASDTAKEIAKFHPNTPIQFVEDLRERHFGEFQGKNKTDLGWGENSHASFYETIKGGETMKELYGRAEKFLHKIISKHYKDTVLLVGHNGINKALIAIITDKKYEDLKTIETQHNTSINIFEVDENRNHKIHILNNIEHLK